MSDRPVIENVGIVLLMTERAASKCGVAVSTFNRWRRRTEGFPPLPKPVMSPTGTKLWRSDELDAWFDSLPRADPETEPDQG